MLGRFEYRSFLERVLASPSGMALHDFFNRGIEEFLATVVREAGDLSEAECLEVRQVAEHAYYTVHGVYFVNYGKEIECLGVGDKVCWGGVKGWSVTAWRAAAAAAQKRARELAASGGRWSGPIVSGSSASSRAIEDSDGSFGGSGGVASGGEDV